MVVAQILRSQKRTAIRSLGTLLGHFPTHSIEWPAATLLTNLAKFFENYDVFQTHVYSKIFNGKKILYIRGAADVRCPISSQHLRSKYEALFDNNLAFDAIRTCFFVPSRNELPKLALALRQLAIK